MSHYCKKSKTPSLKQTHKQRDIAPKKAWTWQFLHPKYWGIWVVIAVFLPLAFLPLRYQFYLGKKLGLLFFEFGKRRVRDTLINLKLALPNKSEKERFVIARQTFINQGIGIFESLSAWINPNIFAKSFSIKGVHHIIQAQQNGQAVLILGSHFTMLDLGGRLATQFFAMDCVYRPQNNKLLEWLIYNFRRHIYETQISSRNIKVLATRLKAGKVIWYTPDQDFGLSHGIMAPFFGVEAATITAQRRFIKMGNKKNPPLAVVISMQRLSPDFIPKGKIPHYELRFTPLHNYPSDDEYQDACLVNQCIEHNIRQDLSQWMWFHRRFKTQIDGRNYYQ